MNLKISTYLCLPRITLMVIVSSMITHVSFSQAMVEISYDELSDKVKGGLVGQLFGNLNGIKHQFKYKANPGNVDSYTPGLPDGAYTDDDTDIEWVHIYAIQNSGQLFLSPEQIMKLWNVHIVDRRYWATGTSKILMELGIKPPLTGNVFLNPFAEFNVGGQFLCESYGLVAPGLPRTASELGLHYVKPQIDGEPAQMTQFFTSMLAMAYFESDVFSLIDASLASIDPNCEFYSIAQTTIKLFKENPNDWRKTRELLKNTYAKHDLGLRDYNGYELNGSATIAALLYGKGDFVETLRLAFNFGWDADNSAATAGAVLGVIKGYRYFMEQGWEVKDIYENRTRLYMPDNETISKFSKRLTDVAIMTLLREGGATIINDSIYRFVSQKVINNYPFIPKEKQLESLKKQLDAETRFLMSKPLSVQENARVVYFVLVTDNRAIIERYPKKWKKAVEDFKKYERLVYIINRSAIDGIPMSRLLKDRGKALGIDCFNSEAPPDW